MTAARLTRRYRVPRTVSPRTGAHLVVCVDPGGRVAGRLADGRRCGVSAWLVSLDVPEGALLGAGHVAVDDLPRWLALHTADLPPLPVAWVVEAPHLRGDAHAQRRGVERLRETLSIIRARRARDSTWSAHRPHRWKGNVPKDTHHRRVLRVLHEHEQIRGRGACVDPDSAAYQPDAADAVALGAWALGRTDRGGVLPQGAPSVFDL